MEVISFTKSKLPYGWLGNMYPCTIEYKGDQWGSTEALFQAMRFPKDSEVRELIGMAHNGYAAKMVAIEHKNKMVVKGCSETDLRNMSICLRLKIEQHPDLKQALLETGDARIVEDVTARGDRGSNLFWGAMKVGNKWEGVNALGELWMVIREEFKKK